MYLGNLQRDMRWVGNPPAISSPPVAAFGTFNCQTDNTLHERHGYLCEFDTFGGAAGSYQTYGIFMRYSDIGNIAMRVKGSSNKACLWGFGWQTTVAATASALFPRVVGYGTQLDDVLCVERLSGYVDQQLLFFAAVPADAGDNVVDLCVQNMGAMPDQFTSAVS